VGDVIQRHVGGRVRVLVNADGDHPRLWTPPQRLHFIEKKARHGDHFSMGCLW
jgi:hypothetical protein